MVGRLAINVLTVDLMPNLAKNWTTNFTKAHGTNKNVLTRKIHTHKDTKKQRLISLYLDFLREMS